MECLTKTFRNECPCYPAWIRAFGYYFSQSLCVGCRSAFDKSSVCEYAIVFPCSCISNSVHLFPILIHSTCIGGLLKLTKPMKNPVMVFPFLLRTLDKDVMSEIRDVFFRSNSSVLCVCIRCGADGNALTCWKCQKVCYCSNECRMKDIRAHKLICSTL